MGPLETARGLRFTTNSICEFGCEPVPSGSDMPSWWGPHMRRLNLRAFLAGGSALLLVTAGAGASWGFASQPPSDEVEAEEAGEETTGEVVEADVIEGEEDAATEPGTAAPQASGGAGAAQAAGGSGAAPPASPASSEDPPLGSSGDGGTGGNGRPVQDPDRPG
jgi:hypothetical protein